jgi:hypothetical protein
VQEAFIQTVGESVAKELSEFEVMILCSESGSDEATTRPFSQSHRRHHQLDILVRLRYAIFIPDDSTQSRSQSLRAIADLQAFVQSGDFTAELQASVERLQGEDLAGNEIIILQIAPAPEQGDDDADLVILPVVGASVCMFGLLAFILYRRRHKAMKKVAPNRAESANPEDDIREHAQHPNPNSSPLRLHSSVGAGLGLDSRARFTDTVNPGHHPHIVSAAAEFALSAKDEVPASSDLLWSKRQAQGVPWDVVAVDPFSELVAGDAIPVNEYARLSRKGVDNQEDSKGDDFDENSAERAQQGLTGFPYLRPDSITDSLSPIIPIDANSTDVVLKAEIASLPLRIKPRPTQPGPSANAIEVIIDPFNLIFS